MRSLCPLACRACQGHPLALRAQAHREDRLHGTLQNGTQEGAEMTPQQQLSLLDCAQGMQGPVSYCTYTCTPARLYDR